MSETYFCVKYGRSPAERRNSRPVNVFSLRVWDIQPSPQRRAGGLQVARSASVSSRSLQIREQACSACKRGQGAATVVARSTCRKSGGVVQVGVFRGCNFALSTGAARRKGGTLGPRILCKVSLGFRALAAAACWCACKLHAMRV